MATFEIAVNGGTSRGMIEADWYATDDLGAHFYVGDEADPACVASFRDWLSVVAIEPPMPDPPVTAAEARKIVRDAVAAVAAPAASVVNTSSARREAGADHEGVDGITRNDVIAIVRELVKQRALIK